MGQREGLSAEAKRPEGLQLEFRRAPILLVYVMYISSVLEIYSMFPKKKEKMFPALGIPLPLRKVAIFLSPTITISKESDGAFYLLNFNQNQENHHLIYATITGGAPSSWFQPSSVPPHHINISKK